MCSNLDMRDEETVEVLTHSMLSSFKQHKKYKQENKLQYSGKALEKYKEGNG